MIVSQGFKLVLLGLGFGLVGGFALTRVIASLLFGVTAKGPDHVCFSRTCCSDLWLCSPATYRRDGPQNSDPLVALRDRIKVLDHWMIESLGD